MKLVRGDRCLKIMVFVSVCNCCFWRCITYMYEENFYSQPEAREGGGGVRKDQFTEDQKRNIR